MIISLIFTCFILAIAYASKDIEGILVPNDQNKATPNYFNARLSLKSLKSGTEEISFTDSKGRFKFFEISEGTYQLDVQDYVNFYESVMIEVSETKIKAYLVQPKLGKTSKLVYPLELEPMQQNQYFEIPEKWSIWSLFKNPMVMMGLVSFGMMFMMNKMPKPDKEQMEEMNKSMGGAKLPNLFG